MKNSIFYTIAKIIPLIIISCYYSCETDDCSQFEIFTEMDSTENYKDSTGANLSMEMFRNFDIELNAILNNKVGGSVSGKGGGEIKPELERMISTYSEKKISIPDEVYQHAKINEADLCFYFQEYKSGQLNRDSFYAKVNSKMDDVRRKVEEYYENKSGIVVDTIKTTIREPSVADKRPEAVAKRKGEVKEKSASFRKKVTGMSIEDVNMKSDIISLLENIEISVDADMNDEEITDEEVIERLERKVKMIEKIETQLEEYSPEKNT